MNITQDTRNLAKNAKLIYEGACNPRALSRELVKATDFLANLPKGTDREVTEASIRLVHAQLGHLFGVGFGDYAENSPHNANSDYDLVKKVAEE